MTKPTCLLVATVKNEGPYLLEWVAHHRLCGFDRIQMYQNDSSDFSTGLLRTLADLGVIEYFDNPQPHGSHQMHAYRRASETESYAASDWCMVLDIDEFLAVKAGDGTVHDLIAACPKDADAILVNWKVFGSNGHEGLSDQLVTERFTRCEPADDIIDKHLSAFKPLFRPGAFARPGLHMPRDALKKAPVLYNASGLREGEFFRKHWRCHDPKARELAQVNHYATRDLASFLLKYYRGPANGMPKPSGAAYWVQRNRNEEEDLRLAKTAPAVREEMERLDARSGGKLMRMRARSLRHWQGTLDDLMQKREYIVLRNTILAPLTPPLRTDFRVASFRAAGAEPRFSSVRSPAATASQKAKGSTAATG